VQDITERRVHHEATIQKAHDAAKKAEALVDGLRKELLYKSTFQSMVSRSSEMKRIFDILPEVAQSAASVLVLGESGTGKELIARTLHDLSSRTAKPFIAINCGALPDSLLEAELFGYKAGAFTDAKKDKPGKFAFAEGGTLFLDEIGDISSAMQVKLLRVLQEKTFEPLGSAASVKANVRVVAATNRNIPDMVKKGEFREDLFYRINVLTFTLPPLRQRRCDIPLLCNHFITLFNARYGKKISELSAEALELLLSHEFPGNIRELENIIEHAFIFCKEPIIQPQHLPGELGRAAAASKRTSGLLEIQTFDELEKIFIENILTESHGNKVKAAQRLGIDKSTLFRKLKKFGIN
jgi:transcriptional regulator with PAS, ATPase and Fis domain